MSAVLDLVRATQAVVDQLQAAGLRASVDERDIDPTGPFVYVVAPDITFRFGRGADGEFTIWASVPSYPSRAAALQALSELIGQVNEALGNRLVRGGPADLVIQDNEMPLPAYKLTWTQRI